MIPQEAVNALAKHNFEESYRHLGWDDLTDDVKAGWLKQAQAQCEAAAPFIRAQALEDAAEALELPCSDATGYYSGNEHYGYEQAERHAEAWLRARAATERGEG